MFDDPVAFRALLDKHGLTAVSIHGNKSQSARTKALADFKSGDLTCLVATDIAARGIDIDQLPHVVNYELPNVPEDYVHRIGRTGRAQAIGDAISFVSSEDTGALRDLERFIGRGILRKKAENFDLSAPAPPRLPGPPPGRGQNQQRPPQRRSQGQAPARGNSRNAPPGNDPSVYPRHQDPRRQQQRRDPRPNP